MKALNEKTTAELTGLKAALDASIREIGRRLAATPRDTVAFAAMVDSRVELQGFWAAVEDELWRRGA